VLNAVFLLFGGVSAAFLIGIVAAVLCLAAAYFSESLFAYDGELSPAASWLCRATVPLCAFSYLAWLAGVLMRI
jgi:hypothetical protein